MPFKIHYTYWWHLIFGGQVPLGSQKFHHRRAKISRVTAVVWKALLILGFVKIVIPVGNHNWWLVSNDFCWHLARFQEIMVNKKSFIRCDFFVGSFWIVLVCRLARGTDQVFIHYTRIWPQPIRTKKRVTLTDLAAALNLVVILGDFGDRLELFELGMGKNLTNQSLFNHPSRSAVGKMFGSTSFFKLPIGSSNLSIAPARIGVVSWKYVHWQIASKYLGDDRWSGGRYLECEGKDITNMFVQCYYCK